MWLFTVSAGLPISGHCGLLDLGDTYPNRALGADIVASDSADRYLAPGTRVRRDTSFDGEDAVTPEYGVVVHCWANDGIEAYDCYVAFFGDRFPAGQPTEKPYILRY